MHKTTPSNNAIILRTVWHALPGFITLGLYHAGTPLWLPFLFLLPGLTLAALFDGARLFNPELGTLLTKPLPVGFLRDREKKSMSGTFWYLVGVEIVLGAGALLCRRDDEGMRRVACLAIMFLAWADPAAAFVGQMFGRMRPAFLDGKSIEGSMAAGVVSALITARLLDLPLLHETVIKAGVIGAVSEVATPFGLDDNLVMPVFSAILLRLFT
jgi:dolichol kinase